MPILTLPDGTEKVYPEPLTVYQAAYSIGKGLAAAAIAGKVDGELVDTSYLIEKNSQLSIITLKDPEGLSILRHSCAHLLAHAVQSLYPEAQVTIGPVIEDGFYYDFAYERPFTMEDLVKIEQKMQELSQQALPIQRHLFSRTEAIALFTEKGEGYKVEIIKGIPDTEKLSFYQQGDFIDLCRGPHVPSTDKITAYKLLKVAGAYWRGDAKNAVLQRIYGTAFAHKKDLDAYLYRLAEAEKRDHRKLGKKYDLFHIQEEAPGMIFWHPKGWTLYQEIVQYMRQRLRIEDYQEVRTPSIVDRSLWERSGHWDMFQQNMFSVEVDEKHYAVKPMNCPCHVQIYNQGLKSYRDLPLRLAEFGSCHRNEPSGALHGIMRTRNFFQDDAHIFCTEDQVQSEVSAFIAFLFSVYADFGFQDILIKLSTRPVQRVGSEAIWDKAEKALSEALTAQQLAFELQPGEGAFYGPKIEFSLRDGMGRVWQCGTVQIDFSMPVRLHSEYVTEEGGRKAPVMIHRAILGSLERFIGILIEEHAGNFPLWLAPVQVALLNITDHQASYAEKVASTLKTKGFRAVTDLRNEKIGFKIREHTMQRVPYLLIVGDQEVNQSTLSVRTRTGEDLGSMTLDDFTDKLRQECAKKAFN